jgi:transcriptional regulator with XRE-family HTH domain
MRGLREARGLTLKYIASYLGVEFSTLARYERAEWPFRRDHVIALLDVYGVYDEVERADLVELAQNAWRVDQWNHLLGSQYEMLTFQPDQLWSGRRCVDPWWVQKRAEELCVYAPMVLPDLVQARDYADQLIRIVEGKHSANQKVDQLLRRFTDRQRLLTDKRVGAIPVEKTSDIGPARLTAVIEEPVLYRRIGGEAVMRFQLEHLLRLANQPGIDIRILPTQVGLHDGLHGGFTVAVGQRPYPDVAMVEHLGGHLLIEATKAERYREVFGKLMGEAVSPHDSMLIVTRVLEEYGGTPPLLDDQVREVA